MIKFRLDQAVGIPGFIMKAESNFPGFGQGGDGNAIIPLVAVETDRIAQRLKLGGREFGILDLCFLHAEYVRHVIFQPWQNNMQSGTYGIDVIGCNFHFSTGPSISWRLSYHDCRLRSRIFTEMTEAPGLIRRIGKSCRV
jgi:hypothetical protein